MKFVLIVIVLAVLVSMIRGSLGRRRRDAPRAPPAAPGTPGAQTMMLSCAQCGLHLPGDDALPGQGGVFCSAAHRAAYEQAHQKK